MVRRINKVLIDIVTWFGERMYVQDERSEEWGVVTGGCKTKYTNFELTGQRYDKFMESILQDAIRELNEETNVIFPSDRYILTNKMETYYLPCEIKNKEAKKYYLNNCNKQVLSTYYMFTVYISMNEKNMILKNFKRNSEISSIKFENKCEPITNQWALLDHLQLA